ncbi:MAG: PQQ-binding-like beta-propeller repeat protein, partial [Verrucomicrobia bacterium]|nr:PQQ-binding-like beta-propeller repeat protein [Verrucomicrobiota bacterium]
GHVPAGEKVPATLLAEPKVLWRVKLGVGLASPVMSAGKVFLPDNVDGKEMLRAYDAATGKELWRAAIDDAVGDTQAPAGPRCTATVDGDRMYAQSCKGELQCLGAKDGKLLWRLNFVKDFGAEFIGEKGQAQGAARHGNDGAPLVVGPHLIVQAGGTNGAGVVCLDKLTGKTVWKSQNDQAGYAAPVLATLGGVKQIISFTCDGLIGLDLRDGKLLWRVPMKTTFSRHVTTPVVVDDIVIAGSHTTGLIGTRVAKEGNTFKTEQAWLSKEATMNFSSPVAVGQHIYGLGPKRDLFCLDAKTGKIEWAQPGLITSSAGKAMAACIVMGPNILFSTDGGLLVLFPADPKGFKELSRAQICGITWSSPAYANGRLYQRDGIGPAGGELLCVELMK